MSFDDDESLASVSVSNFTPEITPRSGTRKVTMIACDEQAGSPIVERGMRNVMGGDSPEMKRNWERRRSSVAPNPVNTRTAPQLMEFMEGARRRASRVLVTEDFDIPESKSNSPSGSPRGSMTSHTSQEYILENMRNELERCKFDILQMADVGSALLVELEDTKTVLLEAENDKEHCEKKIDVLTDTSNSQKRQINELKITISNLREEMDDMKRKHDLEISDATTGYNESKGQEEGNTQWQQSIALQQLRRAQLFAGRVETAQALFKMGNAEPQVIEIEHRKLIEQQMWKDRCGIMWEMVDDSQTGWKGACNNLEQLDDVGRSLRAQMQKIIEARLRAESTAAQQGELHDDARKTIIDKSSTIKRLQMELSAKRVENRAAEDLGPAVQSALRRVHELKEQCSGNFHEVTPRRDLYGGYGSPSPLK
eukprot:TRINITY_DN13278_c0_g1_i1.p1 TRINITY_DN13278_c0_g1~~TRINITY_DN13278_c0_g1_i1.p1  ORF type:complete len:425 (+),score=81.80 TRINITY_DN13278_c0_g1_i1:41-1315(+)